MIKQEIRYDKLLGFILKTAFIVLGFFILFKLVRYLAPFVIGFLIAMLLEPLIAFFTKRLRMKRRLASGLSVLFTIGALGTIVSLLVNKLVKEIGELSKNLPASFSQLYDNVYLLAERGTTFYLQLPEETVTYLQSIIKSTSGGLLNLLNSILRGTVTAVGSIPQTLLFIIITFLSAYFFSSDRELIFGFIGNQMPKDWVKKLVSIKNDLFSALFAYIRAQLILMTITFMELFIGFSLIGTKYVLTLALGISILDALPFIGTGGIVIPWAVYNFFTGNMKMGLYLLILYLVVLIVRQALEPKILSQQIGVHPLLTLMAMYLGLQWIGVLGVIAGPITMLILKNIFAEIFKKGIKETYIKFRATLLS